MSMKIQIACVDVASPAPKRKRHNEAGKEQLTEAKKPRNPRLAQPLKDHSTKILKLMRDFSVPGFEVTNCIFKKAYVEICYILEGPDIIPEEQLKGKLSSHLEIHPEELKLTRLRAKPVLSETIIRPGNSVTIGPQGSIGAFVEVQGIGRHALLAGHGMVPGNSLRSEDGDLLGQIVVALKGASIPPRAAPNEDYVYHDISLASLNIQQDRLSTGVIHEGRPLHLNEDPEEAEEDMEVRLFTSALREGRIDSTLYYRRDPALKIDHRFISVINEHGKKIHDEGESGLVIVKSPTEEKTNAVGMLVAHDRLPVADQEEERVVSLATPLIDEIEALERQPYCNNGNVRFC